MRTSGNNSLKLVATGAWQGSARVCDRNPGRVYSFSGWGHSGSVGGLLTLGSYDANWSQVGPHVDFGFPGTGGWSAIGGSYVAPATAVRVGIVAQSSGTGTFWFDDLSLTH